MHVSFVGVHQQGLRTVQSNMQTLQILLWVCMRFADTNEFYRRRFSLDPLASSRHRKKVFLTR